MDEIVEKYPWLLVGLFPLFWSGVLLLVGHMGAWGSIASKYRARNVFEGKRWLFQSGRFGSSHYGGCLTIGASQRGLHFSVLFPFRPGHPPLFVPWEDVSVTEGKWLFSSYFDLSFRLVPGARVRVSKRLGDRLQAEMGSGGRGEGRESRPIEPT